MAKPITYAYLETTNYCNLDCSFCNRTDVIGPLKHMSLENWGKLLDGIKTENKFIEITKDIYKDISFKNFILEGKHFCKDNLHPNEKGHQLWAEELSKDLQWIK